MIDENLELYVSMYQSRLRIIEGMLPKIWWI